MLDIQHTEAVIREVYDEPWCGNNIALSILRLDALHPTVSGNKIYKLHYFLQKAIQQRSMVITFGGAYSNHLAATAAACRHYGLGCVGVVRGEEPGNLSPTLRYCLQRGMHLEFKSRKDYSQKEEGQFLENLGLQFGEHILIPEGGFSAAGVRGAAQIYNSIRDRSYTYICCPVGTATTMAGLLKSASFSTEILGYSVLKGLDVNERLAFLLGTPLPENYRVISNYHFGGYAKKTDDLIDFMNRFYDKHLIPLDFVYTGKMMYGAVDMIKQGYFKEGSRILCIHTGGLQGNLSLAPGTLKY